MISHIFKKLKNEIIYGAHIISLDTPADILTVSILLDLPINIISLFIAYLISLIVYSYNYQKESEKDSIIDPDKAEFLYKRKKIFPYLLLTEIIVLVLLSIILSITVFNYGFLIFALILLAGGLLYTLIFKVLTKYIIGFKSIYATLVWAYGISFFPVVLYSDSLTALNLFIFIFVYMRMFINIAFFDIKDIDADKKENLKTIPILLGKEKAINFLNLLNALSIIILIIFISLNIVPIYAISLSVFSLYTHFYLKKSKNADQHNILKYSYIIADAEFIFWPIILFISKIGYYKFY